MEIEENDVLYATVQFLIKERKTLPYQISPATGRGIDPEPTKAIIRKLYESIGREPPFVGIGPDIVAASESEWWYIECKGAGTGKPSTQRNNFDRALASVVSYYEDSPQVPPGFPGLEQWARGSTVFLGLALPATAEYLRLLEKRVRPPLRQRLNLWVLLYEHSSIRAVAPSSA